MALNQATNGHEVTSASSAGVDAAFSAPNRLLPVEIAPRQVILKDRVTAATLVPFTAPNQVPLPLLANVCDLLNREIEDGNTYPMMEIMDVDSFAAYWFGKFGAIMLLGDAQAVDELLLSNLTKEEWSKICLGSFYIKPNYPGRSSHVCNAGFLVSDIARNRGCGKLMGEGYLDWAPKLGYSYSVFNLVYETNVASQRIWDSLGFKRIGRIKGCGNLRGYPDRLVDAIQYGKELQPDGEDFASDDRFDKIRYYLKHGKYPDGADRAEKSRLRSAATHYRLVQAKHGEGEEEEKLMLKDKEVISDPVRQDEIAKAAHMEHHAGINKTTAMVAERYHWPGIKASVSLAIKNCAECSAKEQSKMPPARDLSATTEMISAVQGSLNNSNPTDSSSTGIQPTNYQANSSQPVPSFSEPVFVQTSGSFGIDCGTVTIDPNAEVLLTIRNHTTGQATLPQGPKENNLDLQDSALATTTDQTGVFAEPLQNMFLTYTVDATTKQEPFAVTQRAVNGKWKMSYWFFAKGKSHLAARTHPANLEPYWAPLQRAASTLSLESDRRVVTEALKLLPVTAGMTSLNAPQGSNQNALFSDSMAVDPQLTLRNPGTQ